MIHALPLLRVVLISPELFPFIFLVGSGLRGRVHGLKILTSKYALSKRPPQKPFAAMSNLAPSSLMAEAPLSVSLVTG